MAGGGSITLVACAVQSDHPPEARADRHLYEATYRAITDHYVLPIGSDALTMAGLSQLTGVDNSLSVKRTAGTITLLQSSSPILTEPAPPASDVAGWGAVTEAVVATARQRSAAAASMSNDRLDETIIDGSLTLLDRFSRYAPPALAMQHRESRDGYGGIGVTLDTAGPDVRIALVMPESPAAAAGLARGDRITGIDGVDAFVLSHDEVSQRLRGPIGSTITLAVARDGAPAPIKVSLARSHIVTHTVELTHDDHIAVLRISSFNAMTDSNLAALLAKAHAEMGSALKGIVLDLRDNPGGLLDQSVRVVSLFVKHGLVIATIGRNPDSYQEFEALDLANVEQLPMVVLVNGGSASSAEIVSAALQDTGRAVIVGTSSFGKGTVQNVIHLPNSGELTITWAKLVPPGGYILHEHGVVPTVCTDDLSSVADAKIAPGSPRIELDEAGWTQLRDQCPAERVDRNVDLDVAKNLLADPSRYAQVLKAGPGAAARLALTAGGAW